MNKPWLTDEPVLYAAGHATLVGISHDTWKTYQNILYSQMLQLLPSNFPKISIATTLAIQGNFTSLWNLAVAYEGMGDRLKEHLVQRPELVKLEGKHN